MKHALCLDVIRFYMKFWQLHKHTITFPFPFVPVFGSSTHQYSVSTWDFSFHIERLMQIFILYAVPWSIECICSKQVPAAKRTSLSFQNAEMKLVSAETSVLTLESTIDI